MKKKYEKMLWQIRDGMKKVPMSISGLGNRTASIGSYISTCKDLQIEHENVLCFLDHLQQTVFWEEHIKKADDLDMEEIRENIKYTKEKMEYYFNEYHSWVKERCEQNWN